jgi:hypothetical protein
VRFSDPRVRSLAEAALDRWRDSTPSAQLVWRTALHGQWQVAEGDEPDD